MNDLMAIADRQLNGNTNEEGFIRELQEWKGYTST